MSRIVLAPLAHVALHVVQAPRVRLEPPHRRRERVTVVRLDTRVLLRLLPVRCVRLVPVPNPDYSWPPREWGRAGANSVTGCGRGTVIGRRTHHPLTPRCRPTHFALSW